MAENSGAGRPTTLTTEKSKRICDAIRAGNFFSTACVLAGISENTARAWIARGQGKARGRTANVEFAQFAQDVEAAEAHREAYAVQQARAAGERDWKFWLAFLARTTPERWSPIERHLIALSKKTDADLYAEAVSCFGKDSPEARAAASLLAFDAGSGAEADNDGSF
jgi:hypothetical protein